MQARACRRFGSLPARVKCIEDQQDRCLPQVNGAKLITTCKKYWYRSLEKAPMGQGGGPLFSPKWIFCLSVSMLVSDACVALGAQKGSEPCCFRDIRKPLSETRRRCTTRRADLCARSRLICPRFRRSSLGTHLRQQEEKNILTYDEEVYVRC